MVTRGITDNGQFIKNSWTVPIRNGDTTAFLPQDEVYRLLNDGLRARRGADASVPAPTTDRVRTTAEMLGWAMERYNDDGGARRISVFVLTEITLEYFRLVDQHVLPLVDSTWTHRIIASDFTRSPGRVLAPGDDPTFPFWGSPQPATSDNWNHTWTALGDPERDAYEALRHIYALFGLDVTANPFIDADRVSTAKLSEKK